MAIRDSSSGLNHKRRILIVDDHPLLRQGLAQLLNQEADLEICGEAADAPQALEKISELKPDAAIIDITLEGMDGLELIKMIRSQNPKFPILVLSMHDESIYAERALRAGARGYIMKHEASDVIVGALRRIMRGEYYVSDQMAARFLTKVASGKGKDRENPVENLSDRELEVFTLIGKGQGTRQISKKLCLSIKTVETYRKHIKDKLSLESATDLVRHAVRWVEGRQGPSGKP